MHATACAALAALTLTAGAPSPPSAPSGTPTASGTPVAGATAQAAQPVQGQQGQQGSQGEKVSWAPLGLNTAPWDAAFAGDSGHAIQPLLRPAGIGMLRYGGGSFADDYDWENDVDVQRCPHGGSDAVVPALGAGGCAQSGTLSFSQFSRQAAPLGTSTFATVNYGTGTPAEAAAWVTASKKTPGQGVALWEIGNETYGCWEADDWLVQPPSDFPGYVPSKGPSTANPTCPQTVDGDALGTQILANSYAAHAKQFMTAMKAADKGAQTGVPWAFGSEVPGADVPYNDEWNDTVLSEDSPGIGFVDAHYYPFTFSGATGGGNPTDQQILQALAKIPALYGEIRATLSVYDPRASVIVGETNVSAAETTTVCQPVGALFAAGDVLSWLAAGAQSVDWWNMNNYGDSGGSCTQPDFGMFTSPGSPGQRPRPATPYYGYRLASILARPNARLSTLPTSDLTNVLAFQSALPGGKTAVAFLNTSTGGAEHVTFTPPPGLAHGHPLRSWAYNAARPSVVTGTADPKSLANGITLPAESLTVLEGG